MLGLLLKKNSKKAKKSSCISSYWKEAKGEQGKGVKKETEVATRESRS